MKIIFPKGFNIVKCFDLHHQETFCCWEKVVREGVDAVTDEDGLYRPMIVINQE